jgi:hypothetical protein
VSIPGATVEKTANGKYDISVTTPGKINAAILAKGAAASSGSASVGTMEIRVKSIPDPIAKVANKTGGIIPAAVFRAQLGIVAVLENFDFEAKFNVTSFDFSYLQKRGEYQGPFAVKGKIFTAEANVNKYLAQAKAGDKIFIENIRAIGPDNRPRQLNNILLTLN